MKGFTPADLAAVFRRMQGAGLETVVVGGQAVNLWAARYLKRGNAAARFRPFASEDLDCFGSRDRGAPPRDPRRDRGPRGPHRPPLRPPILCASQRMPWSISS